MNNIEVKAFTQAYCEKLLDIAAIDSKKYKDSDKFEFEKEFAKGQTGIFLNLDLLNGIDMSLGYMEKGVNECDIINSELVYKALFFQNKGKKRPLTPLEASDRRIWTYLSHSYFFKYMQKRWGTGDISKRYFMPGKRSQLRFEYLVRQGVSRLWWMAHLTYDSENLMNPFHLLSALMKSTDVATAILERKISHNRTLLHTHLRVVESDIKYQNENIHRETIKKVRAATGTIEMAMLSEEELTNRIKGLADSNIQ